MEFSLKRILGVTTLALVLTAGATAVPAVAADGPGPVVTVKGHVTDPDGNGIKGITVSAGCPCDFERGSTIPSFTSGKDVTTSTGYYSFKVRKAYAKIINFTDPDEEYLATPTGKSVKAVTGGYTIDAELSLASILAGTVLDPGGKAARVDLRIYNAETNKEVFAPFAEVDSKGHFHAKVPAGSYKIKFRGNGYYSDSVWYGGAQLKADATAVTVGYNKKLAGLDAIVTAKPYIDGTVTLDGKKPILGVKEKAVLTLTDPNGAVVDTRSVDSTFSFVDLKNNVGLAPGTYTITATPSPKAAAYFVPFSVPVTVTAGTGVAGLVIPLASVPITPANKASATLQLDRLTKGDPVKGKVFRTKIIAKSYGDVAGAKVSIFVGGKKVATRTLNSAGRANWSTRMTGISASTTSGHSVYLEYAGTDTTQPRKVYIDTYFVQK